MEKIWLLIFAATMFCQFQLYKAADKMDIPEIIKNGATFIVLGMGLWTVALIGFWKDRCDMERLTDNYDYCFLTCYEHEGDLCGKECPWYKNCHERLIFERLKHYENLEEQGRLVEVVKCKDCSCFKEIADAYNYYFCNRYGGL